VATSWKAFLVAVQDLEALMQRASRMAAENRQRELLILLNKLELACLALPETDPGTGDTDRASTYAVRASQVGDAFPEFGQYHKVRPSPISEQEEAGAGYAIDDLADILGDIDEALLKASIESQDSGVWHAKFSYEHHFGSHLADLRSYLHRLRFYGP
jgi:hypothetical protein